MMPDTIDLKCPTCHNEDQRMFTFKASEASDPTEKTQATVQCFECGAHLQTIVPSTKRLNWHLKNAFENHESTDNPLSGSRVYIVEVQHHNEGLIEVKGPYADIRTLEDDLPDDVEQTDYGVWQSKYSSTQYIAKRREIK